jgi:hypothetical protein
MEQRAVIRFFRLTLKSLLTSAITAELKSVSETEAPALSPAEK